MSVVSVCVFWGVYIQKSMHAHMHGKAKTPSIVDVGQEVTTAAVIYNRNVVLPQFYFLKYLVQLPYLH